MKYISSQEQNLSQQQPNPDQNQEPTQNKTVVLITDSNGKRIKPKLSRNQGIQWLHIPNVYRASDIPVQTKDYESQRLLKIADSLVVMVGLNEIRGGMSAMQTLRSIEENIKPLADMAAALD